MIVWLEMLFCLIVLELTLINLGLFALYFLNTWLVYDYDH